MLLEHLRTWWRRRAVMQDLRRVRRTEDEFGEWQFKGALEEARSAYARGDQRGLKERWSNILQRYRKFIADAPEALALQLDMGWFDEAETLLREAHARQPREPRYAIGLAHVAQRRGDLEGAISCWAVVRRRFSFLPDGFSQGAAALAKAGRFDEAEKLLERAFKKFPRELHVRLEYARLAEARKDWETARSRWQTLRDLWQSETELGNEFGTIGVAMCCRRLGRFDEAEALFLKMRASSPLNPLPASEYAGVAEDRGDLKEAIQRWQQVKSRFPMWQPSYNGLIRVLEKAGNALEADNVLGDAVYRFGGEPSWFIRHARQAEARGDFATAAERWSAVRKQFPQREEGYRFGADAFAAAGDSAAADALRAEHARRFVG